MNKKHVSKVGKYIGMACLLFACATFQSCRDEYFFDDTEPTFVGSSIYDYLYEQGEFKHFLRVIEDLDYKEVLSKTGSKTLFVANDKAFELGIKENWGFTDYSQLTLAHKRIILYGAMLDNAYLLEMLSKMQSTGANAEPIPGQCLRRVTSASLTDTVGLFGAKDLPKNNKEWEAFDSIRLALDASRTMMTHFIQDQLYMKNINERDLQLLVSDDEARLSDIYIYDKKVIREKSDVTCKNGYVHQLNGLLIPPSNMAEELRVNGDMAMLESDLPRLADSDSTTLIFSRLLDRFSVPKPIDANSEFAQSFNRIYGGEEKLYEKKYYTEGSFTSYTDETGVHNALGTLLFDPGWNAYKAGSTDKEQDMAAIFAPSDKAVVRYFKELSGKSLLERYAKGIDNIIVAIDSIPIDIIEPLVRNHMQMSFNSTVPSKFEYIVDDARDPMNVNVGDVNKIMLANNGVVYVMDTVYSPARYNSVIAPVMLNDTMSIFNKAIEDLQYDKYLLSMGNKFGLIVTSDNGLVYYNPYTEIRYMDYEKNTLVYVDKDAKAYKLNGSLEGEEGTLVVKAQEVQYDRSKYDALTNTYGELKELKDKFGNVENLFKEVLEYNIVLGDMNTADELEKRYAKRRKYYMSKGYGTVKVERDAEGKVSHIMGGRELQYDTLGQSKGIPVVQAHSMTNGQTFHLDGSMIQPPTQTVSDVLFNPEFSEFRSLCEPSREVLEYFLGAENTNQKEWNKYTVFYEQIAKHNLVRMFDTYHYTVYVPSGDALQRAYDQGLLTWDSLLVEIETFRKEKPAASADEVQEFKDSIKAGADLIAKFVRYHFQDNSVYVDNVPHALAVDRGDIDNDGLRDYDYNLEVSYETSAFNEQRNKFSSVLVKTEINPETGDETLSIRGDLDDSNPDANVCYVVKEDENRLYNVMTREIQYSGGSVKTSSYAVVHKIDNFLVYGGEGGIYDAEEGKFIR